MTDDELVERMAEAIARYIWGDDWNELDDRTQDVQMRTCHNYARAALAVAEPVIRDRCARIALYYPTPVDAGPHEAHGRDMSAAAIRTGATP